MSRWRVKPINKIEFFSSCEAQLIVDKQRLNESSIRGFPMEQTDRCLPASCPCALLSTQPHPPAPAEDTD